MRDRNSTAASRTNPETRTYWALVTASLCQIGRCSMAHGSYYSSGLGTSDSRISTVKGDLFRVTVSFGSGYNWVRFSVRFRGSDGFVHGLAARMGAQAVRVDGWYAPTKIYLIFGWIGGIYYIPYNPAKFLKLQIHPQCPMIRGNPEPWQQACSGLNRPL